jgi:integrase
MRGHLQKRYKQSWTIILDMGRDEATGKRKQQSISVKGTKRDAEKRLAELLHQLDTGGYVKPTKLTLAQYLEQWLRDYAETNTAPRTYERYCEVMRLHLIPALGAIPLTSLQPHHIQAYYGRALKSGRTALESGRRNGKGGLSAQTVYHIHRILFAALRYATKHNMVGRNVAEAVDPPRPEHREMTTADADGIRRLLEAVKDTHYYPVFFTAIYTGLRRSELLGLRWGNVDLDMATVSVTDTIHYMRDGRVIIRQPKSRSSRRNVDLPPALAIMLREHKAKQTELKKVLGLELKDSDLVFFHADGTPIRPDTVTRAFRHYAERVGLPTGRFHDLRHTHATLLLKQGVHPKIVSERLGHSSIAITLDTYSHVLPGLQKEAARRFDEVLQQAKVQSEIEQIAERRFNG